MNFYLNEKRVSKKNLELMLGKEELLRRIKLAKLAWNKGSMLGLLWADGVVIERES